MTKNALVLHVHPYIQHSLVQLEDISLVEQYGKQIICESWSMFCELMSRIFIYACLADDFDLLLALRWWLKWYIIPGNLDANGSCVHAT